MLESGSRIVFDPPAGAAEEVLSAVGGAGGLGLPIGENPEGTGEFNEIFEVLGYPVNQGGDGGPGVIQLHVPVPVPGEQADNLVLPDGVTLEDLSTPTAHLLLPIFLSPAVPAQP